MTFVGATIVGSLRVVLVHQGLASNTATPRFRGQIVSAAAMGTSMR